MASPTESSPPSVDPSSPDELAANQGFDRSSSTRPLARDRASGLGAGAIGMVIAGLALLVLTIAAGPGASVTAISLIAGLLIVALGAATLSDLVPARLAGAIGLIAGVGLGIAGLAPSPIELAEVGRLLAGAVLFMSSAGILAASRGR
jgi:hypothetical protein